MTRSIFSHVFGIGCSGVRAFGYSRRFIAGSVKLPKPTGKQPAKQTAAVNELLAKKRARQGVDDEQPTSE